MEEIWKSEIYLKELGKNRNKNDKRKKLTRIAKSLKKNVLKTSICLIFILILKQSKIYVG